MFFFLLIMTFAIAAGVAYLVIRLFHKSVTTILNRVLKDEISIVWWRYLVFALYVVGISGGVRIWELEKYITPRLEETESIVLTTERWVLEIYRTIIGTLQSLAWVLLVFFVAALIAFVIVKVRETGSQNRESHLA
ncbi:MAG: hypothetical protein KC422_10710 [Trueperaceae bacterium]|nr:hypothetical protein [Trueperaceae bacterium]